MVANDGEAGDGELGEGKSSQADGDDAMPTPYGSSQLLSGPACSTADGRDCGSSQGEFSVNTGVSNGEESYFILDEGGRHVLDDQGSPARARKWQPSNISQRERYTRQHLATKGSTATCRWLPSVLVSPDHLKVPRARIPKGNSTVKGVTLGVSCHADAGGVGSQPRGILMGTGNTAEELEIVGGERRREIEEIKKRRRFLVEERKRTRPKELDGFMLMDACGCELPDEGRRADVSGRGLVRAVQEDMAFFVRLQTLDAGDNSVPFETFMGLPRLEELRVPCNGIRDFSLKTGGYSELRRLDLSYNNICGDAMSLLARLPNLIDLDLTCNGLTDLPRVTNSFPRLQKLSLERNQLESQAVMDVLSGLPVLRELSLAFNYFTGVKLASEALGCAFPLLEYLDLGFNYITNEDDVSVLVFLGRLQRIILYGNPLAGPTGEDPLGLCVEGLIAKADRVREGWVNYPIEVVTEMPRKRQARGGVGRRRRPYSDIGVTMVDEGYVPSATAFRAAGNETLFRFEQPKPKETEPPGSIVDATLQLARNRCKERAGSRSHEEHDLTFMTGVVRQDDADEDTDDQFLGSADVGGLGQGGMSARLLRRPVDPVVRGDPVKLRMALTALRHTLKHPVTSSLDVPWRGHEKGAARNGEDGGVCRKTAAARARQLPRRPYRLLKAHKQGFCAGLLEGPARRSDMGPVDEVLTSMGVGMDEMTLEKRARRGTTPPAKAEMSTIVRTVNAVLDETE